MLASYSYVIWENLEYFLDDQRRRNATDAYIGRLISNLLPHGYTSGGGGYLISKRAVELMVKEGPKTPDCPQKGAIEDYEIGRYVDR
jgi:glycoprotein-N-acetylgalactosamine 3-beta-galactosyltransferase